VKAAVYHEYGSPDVLKLEDVPEPVPGDDEVLIRVHAASINAWDWDRLRGKPFMIRLGGARKPKRTILGADVAGRVEAVGGNVTRLQPGDEVFGDLSVSGWGGFAEYVCARERVLALKPAGVTFEDAAAVPQAALLALQGLHGRIEPGQRVLINGAGGGMGTFAVQLARLDGAHVTGVDSTPKLDTMRSLGADQVIDYTQEDFTRNGQQYDLILDAAGHRSVFDYKRALSPNGRYVMVGGATWRILQVLTIGSWVVRSQNKKLGLLLYKPSRNALAYLGGLVEAGKLTPVIDRRYPLEEIADALGYFGTGQVQGKVVITI
jgi:NADPH:quinone reductase-like Zn-dependent oxidoreductase